VTPRETTKEINDLISSLIGLSLCNEQHFPVTSGAIDGTYEISVSNSASLTVALKNVPYAEIFSELSSAGCFNAKMLDGALLGLRYRFKQGHLKEHSLTFFPSPDLEHFQNEPELYLEDEIYADVISRNIVPFPVRFDYSDDQQKFVELDHPYSHMTLGQFENCRIPVCSPLTPLAFGTFILRNFYNTAYRKYSDSIPTTGNRFSTCITPLERKWPHLMVSG
jgi:hypothetical protein